MAFRFLLTTLLTLGPVAAILYWLYRMDVQREPFDKVLKTFFLGVASTLPGGVFGLFFFIYGNVARDPVVQALVMAFLSAAIPEEFVKMLVIRYYSARQFSFDEPMDGMVYGASAALGFAALENVLYVSQGTMLTALMRAVSAVPMHAILGAVIGYSISRAMFVPDSRTRTWMGYAIAALCHGLYNFGFLAFYNLKASGSSASMVESLLLLPLAVIVVGAVWMLRTARRLRAEQLRIASTRAATVSASEPSYLDRFHQEHDDASP